MSSHQLNSAFTASSIGRRDRGGRRRPFVDARRSPATLPRMLDFIPNATAIQLGPLAIGWYGIGYAVGLDAAYLVMVRLARWAGEDPDILGNGLIVVAIAALIGGRAYHVIDQWDALYKADPSKIFVPPRGPGVRRIVTGTIAAFLYARYSACRSALGRHRRARPVRHAGDRTLGELLHQGLGTPTTLPWGIPIDCAHRLDVTQCRVPGGDDALPPALPLRVDVRAVGAMC